jgi:hypothetical protein
MDFMKVALPGKEPGDFQPPQPMIKAPPKVDTADTAPGADEAH